MFFRIRNLLKVALVISICVGLSVETDNSTESKEDAANKGKSRKKRRGCKCVQRYMTEVDKMIDTKLKEFRDVYLATPLHEKKDTEAARMRDALLRLSGDVAETKNTLRVLTTNMESVLEDLNNTQKDYTKISKQLNRISGAVANLTKYVDNLEQRIVYPPNEITVGNDLETSTIPKPMPTQCQDVFEQGGMKFMGDYYIMIKPAGVTHAFKALCKMVNNSGWTVIQKRQDGSVDFYRTWEEYRHGFGTLEGEFWLGNDNIHYLTSQEDTMLRVEMEEWSGKKHYAVYNHFKVDGAKQNYRLHISGYSGNAGDSMTSPWENHDGMPFSTKDQDNDGRYYDSCAEHYKGAWWFNNCFEAHLNGRYYHKGFHKFYFQRDGIQWNTIHMYSSLKAVQMMVKPADNPRSTASNELTSNI
ncbi:fibrinogen-like protein 1 isoform X2 [Physella acuta]|uniref:fibrinogen-like protein 1 isoform X2 n=1 Tax=Physella acuta TaxID=109671 RepID=UPI0027DE063F|nr:fibrinogen-like protein 1 isoform X2 [Physella acuta]